MSYQLLDHGVGRCLRPRGLELPVPSPYDLTGKCTFPSSETKSQGLSSWREACKRKEKGESELEKVDEGRGAAKSNYRADPNLVPVRTKRKVLFLGLFKFKKKSQQIKIKTCLMLL